AYIFFESMFATYVEVLLAMRESVGRDRLLARAFCFVDEMLTSDDFFRILLEERVWNMSTGAAKHARFSGQTWIAQHFVQRGLQSDIQAVLSSMRPRLTSRSN
ncbi:MAG: hypothetical protein ACREHD_08840, partial [Pirellulales bacterium]